MNILPSSRDTDLESNYRVRYGKSLILLLHKKTAVAVIYSIAVCKFVEIVVAYTNQLTFGVNTGFIREKALLLHEIAKELLAKLGKFAGAATSAVFVDFSYSDDPEDP